MPAAAGDPTLGGLAVIISLVVVVLFVLPKAIAPAIARRHGRKRSKPPR